MKKTLTACILAFSVVVGFAQTTTDQQGVTTSTDPAKAAAVERQGSELRTQDQKVAGSGTASGTHRVKAHNVRSHRHHKAVAAK
jgi:hypothetical protein